MASECFHWRSNSFSSSSSTACQVPAPEAARLLGAADGLYAASGTQLIAALGQDHAQLVSATLAALGEERFDTERQRGAALSSGDAIDLALVDPARGPGRAS